MMYTSMIRIILTKPTSNPPLMAAILKFEFILLFFKLTIKEIKGNYFYRIQQLFWNPALIFFSRMWKLNW